MNNRVLGGMGLAVLLAATSAALAGELNVAVINIEKVVTAHPDTKAAKEKFKERLEKFDSEKQSMMQKRDGMVEELRVAFEEAENKALNDETREKKLESAKDKRKAVLDFERQMEKDLRAKRKDLTEEEGVMLKGIMTTISQIVETYAKEHKLDIVLDSSVPGASGFGGVIYRNDGLDITAEILKIVEGRAAAGSKKTQE